MSFASARLYHYPSPCGPSHSFDTRIVISVVLRVVPDSWAGADVWFLSRRRNCDGVFPPIHCVARQAV